MPASGCGIALQRSLDCPASRTADVVGDEAELASRRVKIRSRLNGVLPDRKWWGMSGTGTF